MKKLLLLIIIMIFTKSLYSLDYDMEIKRAVEFGKDKKYNEAEKIYEVLYDEYKTREVFMLYTDVLSWNNKLDKAIGLVEKYKEQDDEIKMKRAKLLFWNYRYEEACRLYSELESLGVVIDESGLKFLDWYKNYKKYEIKINLSREFGNGNDISEIPAFYFTYDNYKLYAVVLSHELQFVEGKRYLDTTGAEFYYKNIMTNIGYAYNWKNGLNQYFAGTDVTFGYITPGVKYTSYNGETDYWLFKLKGDFQFDKATVAVEGDITDKFEIDNALYKAKVVYNNTIKYEHFFKRNETNKVVITLMTLSSEKFPLEVGFFRDYYTNSNGINCSIGYKF